jgi:hypothetical protein
MCPRSLRRQRRRLGCDLGVAGAGNRHLDLRVARRRLRTARDDDAGGFPPAGGAFQPHASTSGTAKIMRMRATMLGDPTAARRNHFCSPVLSTPSIARSSDMHRTTATTRPAKTRAVLCIRPRVVASTAAFQSRGPCNPGKSDSPSFRPRSTRHQRSCQVGGRVNRELRTRSAPPNNITTTNTGTLRKTVMTR